MTCICLQPMTAAVWSTPPDKCALDFPARTLVSNILCFLIAASFNTLLDPVHAQSSPPSNFRKAILAHDQRRKVREPIVPQKCLFCDDHGRAARSMWILSCPNCVPSIVTSQRLSLLLNPRVLHKCASPQRIIQRKSLTMSSSLVIPMPLYKY